ncbi:NF-X1-type zinc finger protein NFXL1-like [Ornithodoros turicata]|uniref:NF-X1-type zinc finger protein NFXL1-like n=1 Tax=Ornithodoros turicata TaxID=34597 RepID=UPI00313A1E8A
MPNRRSGGRGRGRQQQSPDEVGAWLSNNVGPHHGSSQNGITRQHERRNLTLHGGNTDTAPVASRRFDEACRQIQEQSKKFLLDTENAESSSSSEDELETEKILSKVINSYADIHQGEGDLRKTVQFLTDNLVSGATVCLVCIESVKRNEAVWSCNGCYCILHLGCIQKWAKDSTFQQTSTPDQPAFSSQWNCPKCRKGYRGTENLSKYLCFCGKVADPAFDPWLVPHSCGQMCEQDLKPSCGHRCLLLCHPGPCPPCPKMVRSTCYCEKATPQPRRCGSKLWSCGNVCKKRLSCGQHSCEQICHGGECQPCSKESRQKCSCGSSVQLRPCASPRWQCNKVCGRPLSCGHHSCEVICHSGSCGSCPKAGARSCPCGKSQSQLPCTVDVPPCGDTCDKTLECGLHRCSQRCHTGPCGSCLQMSVKRCQCSAREKSVPCSKPYYCETKCKRTRDCRRHPCNKKCCNGSCPPCEQPCNRMLACKNHKCTSRCHQGPCYPCHEKIDLSCRCGSTKVSVPCGREKVAKTPNCTKPCMVPPDCHHPQRLKHPCHNGRCPSCGQKCGKTLSCGHVCSATCHTAVYTKIIENQAKRAGPWEPLPTARWDLVTKPCPPCQVPMEKECRGKHSIQSFPCSELRPYSCGRDCGRLLACTNHRCSEECHVVEEAPDAEHAGKNCRPCEEQCVKARADSCVHPCTKRCHPGACPPCTQYVKMKCHCGLNLLYVQCHQWALGSEEDRRQLQSCKNRCCKELECSHRCPVTCHDGPCPPRSVCKKKVSLKCPCRRIKVEGSCNGTEPPTCDSECAAAKKAAEAERLQKELEEQKASQDNEAEITPLEYHPRRKRRDRRRHEVVEEDASFWVKHKVLFGLATVCTVFVVVVAYYVN